MSRYLPKLFYKWHTVIKSTYFMHNQIHLQTWHSPDGHTLNQIDLCWIDGRHFSDVIDIMARRGGNIDSDHTLIIESKNMPCQPGADWPYNEVGKMPRGPSSLRAPKAIGALQHHNLFFFRSA
jgi:hypothetical protein